VSATTQEAQAPAAAPGRRTDSGLSERRWLPTSLPGVVAIAAAAILFAAVGLLVVLSLLDMRSNLAAQVELTEDLLDRISQQEALLEQQVALSSELHESTEEGLEIGREGLDVAHEGVDVGREGLDVGREGLGIGYEGLELGREMLAEIREMRERMPQSPAAAEEPAADLVD
jgi:hypothetical protein